jgi:imidazolonepropionase-like amidohydrolase
VYWLNHVELDDPSIRDMITTLAAKRVSVDPTLMAFRTKFFGNDPAYTHHPRQSLAPARLVESWPIRSSTADWTPEQYIAAKAQWPKLLSLVKLMFDRGVLLTAGTDTPFPWIIPGLSLHEELRLLKEAGIPNAAVLRIATLNAATALGRMRDLGAVAAGKQADLLVLNGDPLTDLANTERIELVIKAGRIYKPGQLLGITSTP